MRIACDVLGTLEKSDKAFTIIELIEKLLEEGHEVVIWSSELSFAKRAALENNFRNKDGTPVEYMEKYSRMDAVNQNKPLFDIAFEDDRNQTRYLASRTFLMVDKIPHNQQRAEEMLDELMKQIHSIDGYIGERNEKGEE